MDLEDTLSATAERDGARAGAEAPGELRPGSAVGRFILLGMLGAGAMGVVYAAYDPELDRKIALKLVLPRAGGGSGGEGRARLVREAQALAKLSHPNVVAVHDVGTHGGSVWIAMEFVAGQTLTEWAAGTLRRWSEVLPILIDVARGVTAAHAAGLVHRDLKPDNVMLGSDGRVRVMDFGLAHGRGPSAAEPALASTLAAVTGPQRERAALALRLTEVGSIQGTPAYMAPEQWQGQEAEPASDQFGWSVMAWEMLFGERPFRGETMMTLAAAVLAGQRRPPPRGRGVPGWLRRVIERGLAIEPARRWPTMAALLAALQQGRARAHIRAAVVVVAGVALLGAGAEGYRRWDTARRVAGCEAMGLEIDRDWNDGARQRIRDGFMATGVDYASTTVERLLPWLDEWAKSWKYARVEVCLNVEVRAVWAEDLLDRAVWCLEDRQSEMQSLVSEFGRANATTVQKAVIAAASLRMVDVCLNEEVLRRQPALPARRGEAMRDVRAGLSRAHSLGLAGQYEEALTVAVQAREHAERDTEWPPLVASARALEGQLREKVGAYEEAEVESSKAYFAAAGSGTWEVAASAAIDLVFDVGYRRARHADGRVWAQHAEVALGLAGERGGLREAQRLNNLAAVQLAAGAYAEAESLFERSLTIREQALGPGHPEVAKSLNNLAAVHQATGAYAQARALNERVLALREQVLGPEHPDVANSMQNLADVLYSTGAHAEALVLHERALALRERSLGASHPAVADSLNSLGVLQEALGEEAKAQALYERALAIREQTLGPRHPALASVLSNLAGMHRLAGAYAKAQSLHERALAIREQALGPGHAEVATSLNNLANVYVDIDAHSQARALYERALTIREQIFGPDHPEVASVLGNLAGVYLADERPADARPLLERAVVIYEAHQGLQPGESRAYLDLARALVATGGDRARALALARKARAGFAEPGVRPTRDLLLIDEWLAGNDDGAR